HNSWCQVSGFRCRVPDVLVPDVRCPILLVALGALLLPVTCHPSPVTFRPIPANTENCKCRSRVRRSNESLAHTVPRHSNPQSPTRPKWILVAIPAGRSTH